MFSWGGGVGGKLQEYKSLDRSIGKSGPAYKSSTIYSIIIVFVVVEYGGMEWLLYYTYKVYAHDDVFGR